MPATPQYCQDEALFPGLQPLVIEPAEPVQPLSADRRRTLRQRADIERGRHPLTGSRLTDDPAAKCGNCRFRELFDHHNRTYPKCVWTPPTLSDAGFRLLIETWCWCSQNRTDGNVRPTSWAKRGTPKARRELVAAGLAEITDDGTVVMHDYLEHQRSADEIDELSRKRAEAGKKGGQARAHGQASAKANAQASATANGKQADGKTEADTETDTELARDTSSKTRARALTSTEDPRFVEFWDSYPRREAKPAALKALAKALGRADLEAIVKGAQRYRDDPNRDPAYTAHAATWLNRDGWNDPPLPSRLPQQPPPGQRPFDPLASARPRSRT
jgi:F0F1-type ATP synthase epsilon subunit